MTGQATAPGGARSPASAASGEGQTDAGDADPRDAIIGHLPALRTFCAEPLPRCVASR